MQLQPARKMRAVTEPGDSTRYIVGVDLGQSVDSTAISVLEHTTRRRIANGREPGKMTRTDTYACRHLERLPLGMSYVQQAARIRSLMYTAPLRGNAKLVVDETGVGKAVTDIIRDQGLHPVTVSITGGEEETETQTGFRVPKLQLVSRLQAMLHNGDLRIAQGQPEAEALKAELQDFQVSYSANTGHARFSAREGRHDDIVLSLAIAVWYAARPQNTMSVQRIHGLM